MKPLNKYIDHTLLKPASTRSQLEKLCSEAREHDFATVCVNPCWIPFCKQQLAGSDVKVWHRHRLSAGRDDQRSQGV